MNSIFLGLLFILLVLTHGLEACYQDIFLAKSNIRESGCLIEFFLFFQQSIVSLILLDLPIYSSSPMKLPVLAFVAYTALWEDGLFPSSLKSASLSGGNLFDAGFCADNVIGMAYIHKKIFAAATNLHISRAVQLRTDVLDVFMRFKGTPGVPPNSMRSSNTICQVKTALGRLAETLYQERCQIAVSRARREFFDRSSPLYARYADSVKNPKLLDFANFCLCDVYAKEGFDFRGLDTFIFKTYPFFKPSFQFQVYSLLGHYIRINGESASAVFEGRDLESRAISMLIYLFEYVTPTITEFLPDVRYYYYFKTHPRQQLRDYIALNIKGIAACFCPLLFLCFISIYIYLYISLSAWPDACIGPLLYRKSSASVVILG